MLLSCWAVVMALVVASQSWHPRPLCPWWAVLWRSDLRQSAVTVPPRRCVRAGLRVAGLRSRSSVEWAHVRRAVDRGLAAAGYECHVPERDGLRRLSLPALLGRGMIRAVANTRRSECMKANAWQKVS